MIEDPAGHVFAVSTCWCFHDAMSFQLGDETVDEVTKSFSVDQDVQYLHGHGPDEKWTYTDKAGHAHHYDNGYPTLRAIITHVPCPDWECGCDGFDVTHYECPECGERINPGTKPQTYRYAGRATYHIDGVAVSEAEFKRQTAYHFTQNSANRMES
jgi:hypothetical protein